MARFTTSDFTIALATAGFTAIGTMGVVLGHEAGFEAHTESPATVQVSPGPWSEDDELFDCRIDGNRECGPTATVPVPDQGGVLSFVPWQTAPEPTWRPDYTR